MRLQNALILKKTAFQNMNVYFVKVFLPRTKGNTSIKDVMRFVRVKKEINI